MPMFRWYCFDMANVPFLPYFFLFCLSYLKRDRVADRYYIHINGNFECWFFVSALTIISFFFVASSWYYQTETKFLSILKLYCNLIFAYNYVVDKDLKDLCGLGNGIYVTFFCWEIFQFKLYSHCTFFI